VVDVRRGGVIQHPLEIHDDGRLVADDSGVMTAWQ
jgi:hypothetical protein